MDTWTSGGSCDTGGTSGEIHADRACPRICPQRIPKRYTSAGRCTEGPRPCTVRTRQYRAVHRELVSVTSRPPLPPFTAETAAQKARKAEDAWNTRDPELVAAAYTEDSRWRNRVEFLTGRTQIVEFLRRKWARELGYRLVKELWTHGENRIAVRFAYEWHDDSGHWFRSYGNENWEFDEYGLMARRIASINDVPIEEADRKFHWPLGRRPDDHPSLSALEL